MKNIIQKTLLVLFLASSVFVFSCKKDKNESPSKTLYFTVYDDNTVNKIDLINSPNAVTGLFTHSDGLTTPEGIAITKDGYLIVTEESTNKIQKMQKNGEGVVTTLYDETDGVSTPTAVTINNVTGKIYWCNSGTGQIFKGSADGHDAPFAMYGGDIAIEYAYGLAMDVTSGKLYISDFSHYIKVGKLDGTGTPEVLWDINKFNGMKAPSNIFIDTGSKKIYWCDESANQVVEANIDGSGTPTILFDDSDGISRPDGIFVDTSAKKIYWTETSSKVIARGNLDGTGVREVLVNDVTPYAIVME